MRSGLRNALIALALLSAPLAASAQEVQLTGPLAGAPAIKRLTLHRAGRLHLGLVPSFTFGDEYVRTLIVGARLEYNILDFLAIGVWGGYGVLSLETGLADEVQNKAFTNGEEGQSSNQNLNFPYGDPDNTNSPDFYRRDRFADQLGRIQWVGAGQLTLVPLRGKLGLVGKLFLDVDVYGFLGVAAVGVQERANANRPNNRDQPPSEPTGAVADDGRGVGTATRVAIAPTFGAGINLYMNKFIGLTLEYRALPFSWNRSGTDECCVSGESFPDNKINEDDQQLSFNQMFSLGVIFALPTTPQVAE